MAPLRPEQTRGGPRGVGGGRCCCNTPHPAQLAAASAHLLTALMRGCPAHRARRVVAVDSKQYVDWVHARFGVTLPGGVGFRAIAGLLGSRVEYRRMDALDVHELGERFDVVLCFGLLHRVTDPIRLLGALADVLAPGGEIVLETYASRLSADAPAIEVHGPGDVYARDHFVYWGFSAEGLRRLARIVGLDEIDVIDELEIDGHARILALLHAAG